MQLRLFHSFVIQSYRTVQLQHLQHPTKLYRRYSTANMSDSNPFTKACCTLKPVKSDYTPVGKTRKVGDLDVYFTGDASSKKAVVLLYDIFGVHPNTQQTADILGSYGYRVAMPDIFRGKPWPMSAVPIDMKKLVAFLGENADENVVIADTKTVVDELKKEGAVDIGALGFCWGGRNCCVVSSKNLVKAIATAHPAMVDEKLAETVNHPALFLPSQDEPDMTPVMDVLKKKPFGDKCEHKRFDDMHHGWCAARSNYKDELNAKRTAEAINDVAKFFSKNL